VVVGAWIISDMGKAKLDPFLAVEIAHALLAKHTLGGGSTLSERGVLLLHASFHVAFACTAAALRGPRAALAPLVMRLYLASACLTLLADVLLRALDPSLAAVAHATALGSVSFLVVPWHWSLYQLLGGEASYVVGFESLLQIHRATARSDGSLLAGSPQTDLGGYFAASVPNPAFIGGRPSTRGCDFTESNDFAQWYSGACSLLGSGHYPAPFDRHGSWDRATWLLEDQLFMVTRLDGFDAEDAMDLVDRGVAADGTFPTAPLMCMRGADAARGARDPECEMVVRYLELAGLEAEWIDTFDPELSGRTVSGYLTGAASMTAAIAGNTFELGAISDNLTSYGAVPQNFFCSADGTVCPASESQTSVARFVRAGATGAHGTVAEPLNNVFPNTTIYLLYRSGYSLGESYLFSQRYLYWQNLTLGDPLTTPYATRPTLEDPAASVPEDGVWTVTTDHPDGIAWTRAYRDDLLLAEATGAVLEVPAELLGSEGDRAEIYVLAEAAAAAQARPGWPVDPVEPTPGVRGWRWVTVAIGPAEPTATDTGHDEDTTAPDDTREPPTDDTGTDGAEDDSERRSSKQAAGGCAVAPGPPVRGVPWMLLLTAMAVRRRQRPKPSPGPTPAPSSPHQ